PMPANTDGKSGARKLPTMPPPPSSSPPARTTIPPSGASPVPKSPVTGTTPSRTTIPPMGASKGQATPLPKRADQIRGVSKIERIDYDLEDPLIDHKGRSRPLYKPRSKRPNVWKPSKPVRVLLGLFPGARVM